MKLANTGNVNSNSPTLPRPRSVWDKGNLDKKLDNFYYEFKIQDTLLHTCLNKEFVDIIIYVVNHKITTTTIVLSLIGFSIVLSYYIMHQASIVYQIYSIPICILLWIPYCTALLLTVNKAAIKILIKTFEFWLKIYYAIIYCIFFFAMIPSYYRNIANYGPLHIIADLLVLGFALPIAVTVISSWDGHHKNRCAKITFPAIIAFIFSAYGFYIQFGSLSTGDTSIITIYKSIQLSGLSIRINAAKVLSIFIWKQTLLSYFRSDKAVLIKIHPILEWRESESATVPTQTVRNAETIGTKTQFICTLQTGNSYLTSLIGENMETKLFSVLHHTISFIFISISLILWFILYILFSAADSLTYPIYLIVICTVIWIPFLILHCLSVHSIAMRLIIENFEFWIKMYYLFIFFASILLDRYIFVFAGNHGSKQNTAVWIVADVLFEVFTIPLLICIISSWDGFNFANRKWKIIFTAIIAVFFALYAAYKQFVSFSGEDESIVTVYGNIRFSVFSMQINSIKMLSIFLGKQTFFLWYKKGKAIAIKINPILKWKNLESDRRSIHESVELNLQIQNYQSK
eukprot:98362_1